MASVLKGVSDKYISQDDLKSLKGEGAGSSESIRAEAQKELAKLASMSPFDKGYAEQQEKVKEYLGVALYENSKKEVEPQVGVVTGKRYIKGVKTPFFFY